MRWIEALKVWNAEHNPGKWCVAKKGTAEYDQVKAIMERGKEAPKPTGMKPKEMMEHLKAKKAAKAAKAPEKTVKQHIEESDALLAEIDELLSSEKKAAASVPKAPSRDRAAEEKMIREIAAVHAKKYGEESEKRKKVMAFLKEAVKKLREKRAVKEVAVPEKKVAEDIKKGLKGDPEFLSQILQTFGGMSKKKAEMSAKKYTESGDATKTTGLRTGDDTETIELRKKIRAWAKTNKKSVSGLMKVSKEVLKKFAEEHNIL